MEQLGILVPNCKSLYNKIGFSKRTLTYSTLEFSTKYLGGWVETSSGSASENEVLVIAIIFDENVGEDGVPNFQEMVSTRRLVKLLGKSR